MEDKMKISTISLALCFAFAPFAAHATANAVQHHRAPHHSQHLAMPKTTSALVPAVKLDDDTDGLTRNVDECNRGCVDSN
jgi:hypothetical protein